MDGHQSVSVLMIVVIAAFLTPIVLHKLRWRSIPVVVAEIAVGLLLGQSGLGVITGDEWLELLSTLGIIYLMFLSGLEIDFDLIQEARDKNGGPSPLSVSLLSFIAIFSVSFLLGLGFNLFGFVQDPFFMTLIISTISLGVTLPVIKEKGILETPFGQSILLTAVIADFVTMVLLAIYVSLRSARGMTDLFMLLLLFAVFVVMYRLINRFHTLKFMERIKTETISIGTRGVFALILFFVVLSEVVGAESILGAFLAGVIVSSLSPTKEFVHQLNAFGYGFLIPIFFVVVGANLDLGGFFKDPSALGIFLLLLLSFYLSKLVIVPVFRRWFGWREAFGAGVLLTSTLSLVIAAAAVGMDLGLIDNTTNTSLVLAAVVTALVSPVVFQKVTPAKEEERPTKVSLIGINSVTLTLAEDLQKDGYDVTVYGADTSNLDLMNERPYPIVQLPQVEEQHLRERGVLASDVLVVFTTSDEKNLRIAEAAEKAGAKQVIARVEDQARHKRPEHSRIQLFSTFFSNKTLLKALVEYPTLIQLVTHEGYLQEIELTNSRYHHLRVRDLPFLGDTLTIRIFRGNEIIVPHGDTVLQLGDRLIISGSPKHVRALRKKLR